MRGLWFVKYTRNEYAPFKNLQPKSKNFESIIEPSNKLSIDIFLTC